MSFLSKNTENFVINGDCRIMQWGNYNNEFTVVSNNQYYVDRWKYSYNGTIASKIQRLSTNQPQALNDSRSFRVTATNSTTSNLAVRQYIEDYLLFSGRVLVFSVWVKSNNPYARISISDGVVVDYSDAHPGDGTWKRMVISKKIDAANSSLTCDIRIVALPYASVVIDTGDYIEFTGAKLEFGSRPTPFVPRPYAVELPLCQRYFEASYDLGSGPAYGVQDSQIQEGRAHTWRISSPVSFKVAKRLTPSVTIYSTAGSAAAGYVRGTAGADYYGAITENTTTGFTVQNLSGTDWSSQQISFNWRANAEF